MRKDTLLMRVGLRQVPRLCVNPYPAYAWIFASIHRDKVVSYQPAGRNQFLAIVPRYGI